MYQLSTAQQAKQLRLIAQLHGTLAYGYTAALVQWKAMFPNGHRPILTHTYRSNDEQNELYEQGRTKPGKIVTYKRGGQSKHNVFPSKANDVAFLNDAGELIYPETDLKLFAQLVKALNAGIVWGGDWKEFKDRPHFEVP